MYVCPKCLQYFEDTEELFERISLCDEENEILTNSVTKKSPPDKRTSTSLLLKDKRSIGYSTRLYINPRREPWR